MSRSYIADIADIASEQWGLVTTAQARTAGASPQVMARLARAGQLERLAHGVYRLGGAPRSQHEDLRAAWLALDAGRSPADRIAGNGLEVVSHRSAAVVLALGDVEADVHEFTVPGRRQTRRDDVVFHRGAVSQTDWTLVEGLPVTTPVRTIADLAGAHVDRGHLATVARDAMTRHDVPADTIAVTLAPHARAYGLTAGAGTALMELLLDEAGVPLSALEAVRHSSQRLQELLTSDRTTELVRQHAGTTIGPRLSEAIRGVVADTLRQSGLLGSVAATNSAVPSADVITTITRQIADSPAVRRVIQTAVEWHRDVEGAPADAGGATTEEDPTQP